MHRHLFQHTPAEGASERVHNVLNTLDDSIHTLGIQFDLAVSEVFVVGEEKGPLGDVL